MARRGNRRAAVAQRNSAPLNELLGPQIDSVELSLREALRLVRAIDLISVHAETEREAMSAVAAQAEILLDEATAHMRAMSQRLACT